MNRMGLAGGSHFRLRACSADFSRDRGTVSQNFILPRAGSLSVKGSYRRCRLKIRDTVPAGAGRYAFGRAVAARRRSSLLAPKLPFLHPGHPANPVPGLHPVVMSSRARMKFAVHFAQATARHVRVNFGRRDAGVSEQFLDDAQVGPVFEQMGGETMTQHVRGDVPRDS